jgi:hypothetical protein
MSLIMSLLYRSVAEPPLVVSRKGSRKSGELSETLTRSVSNNLQS